MAIYATRTCYKCGIKHPQPQMHQKIINEPVGSSKKATTNILGFLDGQTTNSKGKLVQSRASRQNADAIMGVGKRNYTRKKTIWLCQNCVKTYVAPVAAGSVVKGFLFILVAIFIAVSVINSPSSNTTGQPTHSSSSQNP